MNGRKSPGVGAIESSRNRSEIARWVQRIEPSAAASAGRVLGIGQGLEGIARAAACRELVLLGEQGRGAGALPERTRLEPWSDPPRLPFADRSFACVVTLDTLSLLFPGEREAFVEELCRVAEDAVIVLCPFHGEDVVGAMRSVNDLHKSAFGREHPSLSRQLDLGLPELERVRSWLAARFEHVVVEPSGELSRWQLVESLTLLEGEDGYRPNLVELPGWSSAASTQPQAGPCSRHLLVASRVPLRSPPPPPTTTPPIDDWDSMLRLLSYVRSARCEALLSRMEGGFDEKISAAVEALRREMGETVGQLLREKEDLQRTLKRLADDLHEAEAECSVLRSDTERLGTERTHVESTLTQQIANLQRDAEAESADLRSQNERLRAERVDVEGALTQQIVTLEAWIQTIESTRGWKLLETYRRLRDRILGRPR